MVMRTAREETMTELSLFKKRRRIVERMSRTKQMR